eukprot:Clim_evm106s172 gene=Clim_evmTU106s172
MAESPEKDSLAAPQGRPRSRTTGTVPEFLAVSTTESADSIDDNDPLAHLKRAQMLSPRATGVTKKAVRRERADSTSAHEMKRVHGGKYKDDVRQKILERAKIAGKGQLDTGITQTVSNISLTSAEHSPRCERGAVRSASLERTQSSGHKEIKPAPFLRRHSHETMLPSGPGSEASSTVAERGDLRPSSGTSASRSSLSSSKEAKKKGFLGSLFGSLRSSAQGELETTEKTTPPSSAAQHRSSMPTLYSQRSKSAERSKRSHDQDKFFQDLHDKIGKDDDD